MKKLSTPALADEQPTATVEERAQVNRMELAYETFGDPSQPALLLVMGLGMQMIHWDRQLCELLAGRGFHVIRFDNRDSGLSTQIDAPVPNLVRGMAGLRIESPYLLEDMADDAFGLLDHLDIEAAHVVGASASELRAVREAMLKMLKENGPPPEGRFADLRYLEPVRDYNSRHASTMLTFDAVVDAIEQIERKADGVAA